LSEHSPFHRTPEAPRACPIRPAGKNEPETHCDFASGARLSVVPLASNNCGRQALAKFFRVTIAAGELVRANPFPKYLNISLPSDLVRLQLGRPMASFSPVFARAATDLQCQLTSRSSGVAGAKTRRQLYPLTGPGRLQFAVRLWLRCECPTGRQRDHGEGEPFYQGRFGARVPLRGMLARSLAL